MILKKIYIKHKIQWKEVEEIFVNKPRIFKIKGKDQYGETRYIALGETLDGRYLTIIYIRVDSNNIKVITARNIDNAEKKI